MDSPELTTALTGFLIAFLTLLGAAITALTPRVMAWLRAEETKAVAAGHGQQVAVGKELAQSAVLWAEQWIKGSDNGRAKRDAAAAWLAKLAHERGLDLPLSDAEKLVEEAVRVMQAAGLDVPATQAKRATQERERDAKGRFTKRQSPADAATVALLAEGRTP